MRGTGREGQFQGVDLGWSIPTKAGRGKDTRVILAPKVLRHEEAGLGTSNRGPAWMLRQTHQQTGDAAKGLKPAEGPRAWDSYSY